MKFDHFQPSFTASALILLIAVSTFAAPVAGGVRLEQIISREDPAFNCARAVLAVGRDGRVYLASGGKHSFVLRISPEGKEKFGAVLSDEAISMAMISVYRALNGVLKQYGPWLTTLAGADRVAIIVERCMVIIDSWDSVMPKHFSRLFEAYISCLHAHQPATFVFAEDIQPDTLRKFNAVLLVDQRVRNLDERAPQRERAVSVCRQQYHAGAGAGPHLTRHVGRGLTRAVGDAHSAA